MESEDAVKNWYDWYHFGEAEEEKALFKEKVLKYGIACYKKRCRAALGDE